MIIARSIVNNNEFFLSLLNFKLHMLCAPPLYTSVQLQRFRILQFYFFFNILVINYFLQIDLIFAFL